MYSQRGHSRKAACQRTNPLSPPRCSKRETQKKTARNVPRQIHPLAQGPCHHKRRSRAQTLSTMATRAWTPAHLHTKRRDGNNVGGGGVELNANLLLGGKCTSSDKPREAQSARTRTTPTPNPTPPATGKSAQRLRRLSRPLLPGRDAQTQNTPRTKTTTSAILARPRVPPIREVPHHRRSVTNDIALSPPIMCPTFAPPS